MAKNSFAPMAAGDNQFSRKWGTSGNEINPFISGYHGIRFSSIPVTVLESINMTHSSPLFTSVSEIKNTLQSANLAVTIPGKTINNATITGLGGITYPVPTGVSVDNTFSMRFLETSSLPISYIIKGWVRTIRDYRAGVSLLSSSSGSSSYTKANYSTNLYYWVTKPDGVNIEYACCLTGVYPNRDPSDSLSSDIANNNTLELDIDFSMDYMWEEAWVLERCAQYAQENKTNAFNGLENTGTINEEYRATS